MVPPLEDQDALPGAFLGMPQESFGLAKQRLIDRIAGSTTPWDLAKGLQEDLGVDRRDLALAETVGVRPLLAVMALGSVMTVDVDENVDDEAGLDRVPITEPVASKRVKPEVLIKSRERVRRLAEVYTGEREVKAMVDLVDDMFPKGSGEVDKLSATFFEPACGNGNFLVEILARKLAYVVTNRYRMPAVLEARAIQAVGSIYAVDIDRSNVEETRQRLFDQARDHLVAMLAMLTKPGSPKEPSAEFEAALRAVLETNIKLGNTLTDLDSMRWVRYTHLSSRVGYFVRSWTRAGDDTVLKKDPKAVHYTELGSPDQDGGVR